MPQKPKFTREEIIDAALTVVSLDGINALAVKSLGHALNTSATPIFTVFNSMHEVVDEVKSAAMKRFESYAHKTDTNMPIFKQVGVRMILFVKDEPQLYQLIFMSPYCDVKSFADIYSHLGGVADECLDTIQRDYDLPVEALPKHCLHICGFTHMALKRCVPWECAILLMMTSQKC